MNSVAAMASRWPTYQHGTNLVSPNARAAAPTSQKFRKIPLDTSTRQLYSVYKQYTVSDDTQIRIDLDASTPVNRQIVDQIRTLLVEGVLPPGADLPSVRRLATDLGVHFATVADAYRTLAEEGWLEISHGRSARGAGAAAPPPRRRPRSRRPVPPPSPPTCRRSPIARRYGEEDRHRARLAG